MADDVRQFFESYGASFLIGPSAVAEFYHEPCITARMGATHLNVTRRNTEEFFVKALEAYRSKGFADGAMLSLDSRAIGSNSAIATVRWVYKDTAGKPLWEWTFTYNLYRSDGQWRILLQTMHDA
jgi:hypothetical protein